MTCGMLVVVPEWRVWVPAHPTPISQWGKWRLRGVEGLWQFGNHRWSRDWNPSFQNPGPLSFITPNLHTHTWGLWTALDVFRFFFTQSRRGSWTCLIRERETERCRHRETKREIHRETKRDSKSERQEEIDRKRETERQRQRERQRSQSIFLNNKRPAHPQSPTNSIAIDHSSQKQLCISLSSNLRGKKIPFLTLASNI